MKTTITYPNQNAKVGKTRSQSEFQLEYIQDKAVQGAAGSTDNKITSVD